MSKPYQSIVNTSAEYFNTSPPKDDLPIHEFLQNNDIHLLAATIHDNLIYFTNTMPSTNEQCLIFYKIPKIGLASAPSTTSSLAGDFNDNNGTQNDFAPSIGLLTLEGGIIKSIYNSMARIFSPQILKKSDYTPELAQLMNTLQSSLGTSLGLSESGANTVADEINFWMKKTVNSPTKSDKDQAKLFARALSHINEQLMQLENTNNLSLFDEFLDGTHNSLDEIWKFDYHYPQNRMIDLMNIISNNILEICIENMSNEDVMSSNSFHINTLMTQINDIIESWIQICDTLTRLFWPNYSQHQWMGDSHVPPSAVMFKLRLAEIQNIKNLYKQVACLFNEDANYVKLLNKMFVPFKDTNIFDITAIGQNRWKKAVNSFETFLEPIDDAIANTLNSLLQNHFENPRQLIHIFSTFDIISKRSAVLQSLTAEREQFARTLTTLLSELQTTITQTTGNTDYNENISPIVWESRWIKIVEYQISEIEKIQHICNDRKEYAAIEQLLKTIKTDVDGTLKENFRKWCADSLDSVKHGELKLHEDRAVVEFERDGRQYMKVTFNPEIIVFCNDIRELENLGFKVPIELRETASHGLKFISYARSLQQIACFHNTIGDRMIACQRPIMLKNAIELSNLVQSDSVAWNDEESVRKYVSILQIAVNKLSKDNTLLVGYHEQIKKTVIKLMNTDLLKQSQTWKDEMRHLREFFVTLERHGYSNLQAFKLHWDYQLYKVLEYQYVLGLVDINQKLPDIHIDLVFRQQQLQFRPTLEEIYSKYYSQLRRFIERPLSFRGLSDQSQHLFKIMVERNRHYFHGLYKHGQSLMEKLIQFKDKWMSAVSIGCVDVEQLCNVHLSHWSDWDLNFKACKQFSQKIARIQNSEEKIDCLVINISPLRSDIEFIARRYWETLNVTLRGSILQNISVIQEFLQSSLQVLQNIPLDETGIADAGAKYEKIVSEMPRMSEMLKSVKEKDTCLAGWCKERVTSLNSILLQWEQLQPLIDNHHSVLQRQLDIMKDHIVAQVSNLAEEVEKFEYRWESTINQLESNENTDLTLFNERQSQWALIQEKHEKLLDDSKKFNTDFSDEFRTAYDRVATSVDAKFKSWELYQQFVNELHEIGKEEWTVYRRRPYTLVDFLNNWQSKSQQTNDENSIVNTKIRMLIEKHQSIIPILQALQSDSLVDKHWAKILSILGIPLKSYHEIELQEILKAHNELIKSATEIQNLVRQASSEQIVRQALVELEQWGVTANFKLTSHTDSKGQTVMLIKDFHDTLNKIGDNQCLLQSAKNSTAFESFSDQAAIWESRLNSLDRILTAFNQIQRKWIYLEPIFGAGTLKSEGNIFQRIDKDFRYIMKEVLSDPRVLSICKIHNILTLIDSLEIQLSKCQHTLTSYITEKRNAFPRFYFLGNDDLLEILGQASKENIIQKHIKKLFPGIHHVQIMIQDNLSLIQSICSAEGDEIKLKNMIPINDVPVEKWLNSLVNEIKFTLKELIFKCAENEQNFDMDTLNLYPIQVLSLSKYISFTKKTERAITSMGLQGLLKAIKDEIFYLSKEMNSIKNNENNLLQLKIRSLLIDLVHQSSIVEYLIEKNVTKLNDWHWLEQLKFYVNYKLHKIIIKMVHTEFEYSYEYLGNYNKLVNTHLTHKCYLTLTQAMQLGLGGNPFGPAGTGKTECVKALGSMFGRLVLVFNCNENIDTTAMGLILSGLARCGAWGCFDEFNRLEETTLSAISMLIQPLQQALKEKQETVIILDDPIPLNHHCGVFVTLNPAGEEYGGRQNLPANLQALFRPIIMQQPEPKEIARVLLFVEGFQNSEIIGARMVELFTLANKILSPQRHYDWGLRELKTVLTACGKVLRELNQSHHELSHDQEIELAVRSLRANTMSKLTVADCQKFDMLIRDIFPQCEIKMVSEVELRQAIADAITSMGGQTNERQLEKCLELNEQLQKRMGVVVIGPPNSGKTTLILALKQALTSFAKTIRIYTISPKSMTREQLLGKLDADTRQWNDGVLTTTAVAVNSEGPEITSWIVCDGDVDPDWIEALNSVLDDNRLLTLPSGWRIQFDNNVNFIFETHDLSHASPATISRMGIVNLSAEDLNGQHLVTSWLAKQTNQEMMQIYLDDYFQKSLEWIWNTAEKPLEFSSKIVLIKCALFHIPDTVKKEEFCIGLLRGLGGLLDQATCTDYAQQLMSWADIYVTDQSKSHLCYYNKFRDAIEIYQTDENAICKELSNSVKLINTGTVKVHLDVIKNFLSTDDMKCVFLLYGPAGCGKTLLLENAVTEFSGFQFITIKCSAQLTSSYVLYILRQNCLIVSGVRGREYKPRSTKLILYFKNIDLCPVDNWGSSEVIELLLQLYHRNGFYSDKLEWISVTGLQICGSFSKAKQNILSARFLSVARFLVVDYPNKSDMQSIVSHQLLPIYNKLIKSKKITNIERIVDAIINIYTEMKNTFQPTANNHYLFTPKMVTIWIQELIKYPDNYLQQAIYYEAENIFCNRLISNDDILKYKDIIFTNFRNLFDYDDEMAHYFVPVRVKSTALDYVDAKTWNDTVKRHIGICATEDIIIENPITTEFLQITASVCRSLARVCSNLILCGPIGSNRRQALHLACSIQHIKVFLPQQVKNYALNDFYNDLRMAMQSCALDDQITVFLVDHSLIAYLNDVMKPIEAILEGSEIPDLFGDDLEAIANPLRNAAQMDGYQESLASYFLKRVQYNLHLVVSLESTSNEINDLFRKYPALYRNTDIIWIQPQCAETIDALPKLIIDQLAVLNTSIPVVKYFSDIISLTGDWSASPYRYNQLIKSYFYTFHKFMSGMRDRHKNLEIGIEKLSAAHSVVATLKSEAGTQEEALAEKRKLAGQALEMISSTMRNATDQRSDLLELKKKTQESSEILKVRKLEIEQELKEVEPVLKEASAAVGQIKTEALSEIRSLRAPPDTIRDILEGVLRLMGIRDTSWNSMKTFLAKRGIKEDIRSLDPARISPENCAQVEQLLHAKAESFETKNAKRASNAAAPLAAWVIANVRYSKVMQSIKPLEREQYQLQQNLDESENQMKSLVSGLDDVDVRVKELSNQLNGYTQEAAVIEIKLDEARKTLTSAEMLIVKLNSEFVSWSKQLAELNIELETLDRKSFFVALCITHLSHLSLEQRVFHLEKMATALNQPPFTLDDGKLITDQNRLEWETMGLSPDSQSIQNAALLIKLLALPYGVCPIPLLIDPTGTCFHWIQSYLASTTTPYEVMSQNHERFTYQLELAVRFGKILIVQDTHAIRPPLLAVITSELHSRFNKKQLQVGNKFIDLHDDFKLILVAKVHSAHCLTNAVAAYIAPIQFTITTSGLTDQLLSKTILLKRPDLEEKRIALLKNEGDLLKKRFELQDKLLYELSTSQGDILKNDKLIKTLNDIKESSSSIDTSLAESSDVRNKLMADYNQFKELCALASQFYIGINKVYYLSVTTFFKIFLNVLAKEEDFNANLIFRKIVRLTFTNLSRSVIKSQHLSLALIICKNAFPDEIPDKEWESFVTNFMTSDDVADQSYPKWITKKDLIAKVCSLKFIHPNFYNQLNLNDENLWKSYIMENGYGQANSNTNKLSNSDGKIPVQVSEFQKILLAQIFRPDQMVDTMMKSASKLLGVNTLLMPQLSITQIIDDSRNDEPILFITLSGTDPIRELKDYAAQKFTAANHFVEMSVGKDSETKALQLVRKTAEEGRWLCLKNIHLLPKWLNALENELFAVQPVHETFRIFLTCETIKDFSDGFLSKCNKILYEAPDGIKNKLQRLLQQWSAMLQGKRDPKIYKLYIILFILNAMLQERRSFIPQGWCKWYEFGDSDLRAAIDFITLMENTISNQMEWSLLRGLFLNIAYGGRIDNVQDHNILVQHLDDFFNHQILNSHWTPMGLNINIPQTTRIQDYYAMIAQIPDQIRPEMFGLSKLTNLSKDLLYCRNLLKELRHAHFHTNDNENFDKRIRPILSLWKKLSATTNLPHELHNENDANDEIATPWTSFLMSEMRTAQSLFHTIHTTLATIHVAIKQFASMRDDEKKLLLTLCENQVPLKWRQIWPGPKLATEYMRAFIARAVSTQKRLAENSTTTTTTHFCKDIDFATIYNVDGFFGALKLTNARTIQHSACDLKLSLVSEFGGGDPDTVAVKIHPVLIEGAVFKNGKLAVFNDSSDATDTHTSNFVVTFVHNGNGRLKTEPDTYYIPLYNNNFRENLIANIPVPLTGNKYEIIYSGAALIVPDLPLQ